MEHHNPYFHGFLGTVGAFMSGACHWMALHEEGLNHGASVAGIWIGLFVAVFSGINVVIDLWRKWSHRNDKD